MKKIFETIKGLGLKGAIIFAILFVFNASIVNVDAGRYMMEQKPSGELVPHMTPGYKFIIPFVTSTKFYNEVTTVTYDENPGRATSSNKSYPVTFADTYGGDIQGSFRIELPKDPEQFVLIHKAFKRYDNFVDNGIEKFTNELLAYTANQYTGEAFMQGGQNEYKSRLFDQATKGLYVTKRTAVKMNRQVGSVTLKNDKAGETSNSQQTVFRNIIQRDENGKPLREANPMAKYGVKVTQVTVDGFLPEPALKTFMQNKKDMIQKRQKLIENQENEKQAAITAKLKGDRERVEAKQKMLREKDAAVIQANKEVELARLTATREAVDRQKLADLAIIDKTKELQIAKANEDIQKANERAAKFEAQSKLHNGLADAQILKAKYDAYDKTLYSMEIQRDTMINVTKNLANVKIEMPKINISGGSDKSVNSMNTILQAIGIDKLEQIQKSIDKK
jgi:hypothetical protein